MEDDGRSVLFFQPFCKGRDRKFLQVHIAQWLCYGWKSGVLLHPGVLLSRLSPGSFNCLQTAETLLISTQETWPLRQWNFIAQKTQVDKLEIDRRLVSRDFLAKHQHHTCRTNSWNIDWTWISRKLQCFGGPCLAHGGYMWLWLVSLACSTKKFSMPTFSSFFSLQRSELPPWPSGIEAGLPWLPGHQNMVGLSESTVPVWWLNNADHGFPMTNMVSLFDMSFWKISPRWAMLTHVTHARFFFLHIWFVIFLSWFGGMTYRTAVRLSLSLAVASSLPILDQMVVSKAPSRDGRKWRPRIETTKQLIVTQWLLFHVGSQFISPFSIIFLVQCRFLNICCWNLFPVLPVTVQLSSCFSCRTKPTFSPRCEGQRLTSVAVFFRGQAWNSEKHDEKLKLFKWLKDAKRCFQISKCEVVYFMGGILVVFLQTVHNVWSKKVGEAGPSRQALAGGPPLRIGEKGLEFELGKGAEGRSVMARVG